MRRAIPLVAFGILLAGCVAEPYQPAYYPPRTYQPYYYGPPPIDYRARPLPPPEPLSPVRPEPLGEPGPEPAPETGPIPLIEMPEPAPENATPGRPAETAPSAPAAPSASATPQNRQAAPTSTGPGSNVPLEGFRPMRGQTRPTP